MPLLKIESTNARILCVVPANAGTHNHRYLLERKAVSHRAKNAGPRRMFAGTTLRDCRSRDSLARNDGLDTRHTSIVIAREGGRSTIPETSVMQSRSRGVLDNTHARGMTASGGGEHPGFIAIARSEATSRNLSL